MTRNMRRVLVAMMLVLAVSASAFAGGSSEASDDQKKMDATGKTSLGKRGDLIYTFAGVIDSLTTMFCRALTPFPSMIDYFYSLPTTTTANGVTTVTGLQVDASSALVSVASPVATDARSRMADPRMKAEGSEQIEKDTWSMVMSLFLAFLALEVVFTSLKMFAMQEAGIVKTVLARVLSCLLLMGICALLPFLVEGSRLGLQQMAQTMYGSPVVDQGAGNTILMMPGDIIRGLSGVVGSIDPKAINLISPQGGDMTISSEDVVEDNTKFGLRTLVNGLTQGMYWFVYLIAGCVTAVTALHVMVNILEVYLLLGIVMCLVPFQVFGMTKFMGDKAIPSLFSNIIELFVICCIFYSTHDMIREVANQGTRTISMAAGNVDMDVRRVLTDQERKYLDDVTNGITAQSVDGWSAERKAFFDEFGIEIIDMHGRFDFPDQKRVQPWIEGQLDKVLAAVAVQKKYLRQNATVATDYATKFSELDVTDKARLLSEEYHGDMIVSSGYTDWSYEVVAVHLFTCLLAVIIQAYFIAQSSQITNALLTGKVSTEGFGGASVKKAFKGAVAGILGAAKAPGGVAKGAANIYSKHLQNKANRGDL